VLYDAQGNPSSGYLVVVESSCTTGPGIVDNTQKYRTRTSSAVPEWRGKYR